MSAGRWSAVDVPPTPTLPGLNSASGIVATTVVGQDPSILLATDGVAVYRSVDSGCHWRTTYTFGADDYWSGGGLATAYVITNIANGHSAAPANRQDVYLALSPNPLNVFTFVTLFGAAPPELIAVSHDGGQTFAIVPPAPTAANPIVPECLSAPSAVVVPPTDSHTVYLQCTGGVAQALAEQELAGGTYAYRSHDGGRSWSLMPVPGGSTYGGQSFVAGLKANELWLAGQWNATGSGTYYLAVWHSTDGGTTWARSTPAGKPGIGIGQIGLAVDAGSGAGGGRVVVYAPIGAFVTADAGKHWTMLRGIQSANGAAMLPVVGFFLRHSVYVVTTTSSSCKAGAVVFRYADPRGRARAAPFPTRWGTFWSWGNGGSFAIAKGATVAFGLATFCATTIGGSSPPKLLSFRTS